MRKLNFFLDIDGTLLPFGKGVPESAAKAIAKASSEGHRFFLSTGRSTAEVDSRLKILPLKGGVFSAGGTVVYDGKTIFQRVFSREEKDFILDYARKNNLVVLLQSGDGTYLTKEAGDIFVSLLMKYLGRVIDIPNFKIVDTFPEDLELYKLLFFSLEGKVAQVRKELEGRLVVVDNTVGLPYEIMAEIVLPNVTKATGIEKMLEYLGEERNSVVAIGDGANDIEMVEYAELGISMGNGQEELKKVASYITDDVEKDGLKKAIEYAIEKLA